MLSPDCARPTPSPATAASPDRALAPGASLDINSRPPDAGFNLYLPHAGATDAGQQGRGLFGPIVVDEAEKIDVDEDFVVVLSDWSFDDKGQIRNDFADPALARGRRPARERRVRGRRRRAAFAESAAGRAGAPETRQRGDRAADQCRVEGAKTLIVAVDGQPGEPFEPLRNQFPMGPAPVSN